MSLWLETLDRLWVLATITLPVALPILLVQFFTTRKTRRLNTEEHGANAQYLKDAADFSKKAAVFSRKAAGEARAARLTAAQVDGRLTGFIEEHSKVHEQLRR